MKLVPVLLALAACVDAADPGEPAIGTTPQALACTIANLPPTSATWPST